MGILQDSLKWQATDPTLLPAIYRACVRHASTALLWAPWAQLSEDARHRFASLLAIEPRLREWSDDERAVLKEIERENHIRLVLPVPEEKTDGNPLL